MNTLKIATFIITGGASGFHKPVFSQCQETCGEIRRKANQLQPYWCHCLHKAVMLDLEELSQYPSEVVL